MSLCATNLRSQSRAAALKARIETLEAESAKPDAAAAGRLGRISATARERRRSTCRARSPRPPGADPEGVVRVRAEQRPIGACSRTSAVSSVFNPDKSEIFVYKLIRSRRHTSPTEWPLYRDPSLTSRLAAGFSRFNGAKSEKIPRSGDPARKAPADRGKLPHHISHAMACPTGAQEAEARMR